MERMGFGGEVLEVWMWRFIPFEWEVIHVCNVDSWLGVGAFGNGGM